MPPPTSCRRGCVIISQNWDLCDLLLVFRIIIDYIKALTYIWLKVLPLRSCFIEFLLGLFASRAAPIVRQSFKRHAVMLVGVIYITADGADIFAAGLLR